MTTYVVGSGDQNVTWTEDRPGYVAGVYYLIDLASDYIVDLTGGRIVLGAAFDGGGNGDTGTWTTSSAVTVTNTPATADDNGTWTPAN